MSTGVKCEPCGGSGARLTRCPHAFKGAECGYSGSEEKCNGTLGRCQELGNSARFGGAALKGQSCATCDGRGSELEESASLKNAKRSDCGCVEVTRDNGAVDVRPCPGHALMHAGLSLKLAGEGLLAINAALVTTLTAIENLTEALESTRRDDDAGEN